MAGAAAAAAAAGAAAGAAEHTKHHLHITHCYLQHSRQPIHLPPYIPPCLPPRLPHCLPHCLLSFSHSHHGRRVHATRAPLPAPIGPAEACYDPSLSSLLTLRQPKSSRYGRTSNPPLPALFVHAILIPDRRNRPQPHRLADCLPVLSSSIHQVHPAATQVARLTSDIATHQSARLPRSPTEEGPVRCLSIALARRAPALGISDRPKPPILCHPHTVKRTARLPPQEAWRQPTHDQGEEDLRQH